MGTGLPTWLAVGALALLVRWVYLAEVHDAPSFRLLMGDAQAYDTWARGIAGGDWLGREVFYQAPLYPYFMGGIYAVVGASPTAVRVVQTLLGAAGCVVLGIGGARLVGRRAGVLAAVALAVYPSAIFADGLIQKSSLDLFLVCALVATLGLAMERATTRWALAAGGVLGALVLTRENALALAPIVGLVLARAVRPPGRAVAGFVVGLTLVLAPVATRNRVVGGEWHLTTAQFGPNLYIGNNPLATGVYKPLRPGRGDASVEREDATQAAERAVGRTLSPGEVSAYWTARAVEFVREQPGAWLRLLGRKALLFVNRVEVGDAEDQYTYGDASLLLRTLSSVFHFGVLIPLAAFGVVIAWRAHRAVAVIAVSAAVYAATTVLTFVMARYRYPAIPPLLVLAATGLVEAFARRVRRGRVAAGVMVAVTVAVLANVTLVDPAAVRAVSLYNIGTRLAAQPETLPLAIDHYRRALALLPGHALAHENLGLALGQQGHVEEALAELRRAVALDPGFADHHYNLAVAEMAQGRRAEAEASFRTAIRLDPEHAAAHNNLGVLLQQAGRIDEALKEHAAAVALDPADAGALTNFAVAYVRRGDLDRAIELFAKAVALDPDGRTGARPNLALALANRGRFAAAAAEYEALLRQRPDDAELHRGLARALAATGRMDGAIAHLRMAVELAPDSAAAREDLTRLLAGERSPR